MSGFGTFQTAFRNAVWENEERSGWERVRSELSTSASPLLPSHPLDGTLYTSSNRVVHHATRSQM